jgi:PAS domain S-box-containing protein
MRISGVDVTEWGPQIRRFRRFRALKQTALAELIGVDQATVSRWESGRQIPDLGMQRRLRDLMRRAESREEMLLKHGINAAVGYTVLCDEDRIIRAASPSFCEIHGVSRAEIIGHSSMPIFTAELEQMLDITIEHGFFEGEVASATVVSRFHALSGGWRNHAGMVSWTPVPLADGRILRRIDRITLSDEQFEVARAENGGPIRLVTISDLFSRTG